MEGTRAGPRDARRLDVGSEWEREGGEMTDCDREGAGKECRKEDRRKIDKKRGGKSNKRSFSLNGGYATCVV